MRRSSCYRSLLAFSLYALSCSLHPDRACSQSPQPPRAVGTDTIVQPGKPSSRLPLLDVLIELNKSKGVFFLFSQQPLAKALVNPPNLSGTLPIEKILAQVLKNTGLSFKKVDDRTFVILNKKDPGRSNSYDASNGLPDLSDNTPGTDMTAAFPGSMMGKVIAADGKALQGVSVTVKGTRKGTSTDLAGVFGIHANKEDILIFSFVGYKTRELPAEEAGRIDILLDPSNQPLTEVLVTALGIPRQERSLGYSTSALDGSRFTQSRTVNLGDALVGQVAGVSVAVNATGPYGSSRVLIRGNASLSGNNQPLYVIDGVPYDNTNQGYAGQWGGADLGDGLSNINPDDIESVLILKGVAASALYGYRGGNGAILVTTKSGSRTHGIGVQVNNNLVFNSVIDPRNYQYVYGQGKSKVKPTNVQMALDAPYYSWGDKLDGTPAVNFLGNTYAYLPAPDNFKNFFRTGLTDQSSVALTGANNKGHFRLGISDLYLNTLIPNSSMKQQGLNFNSTYYVTNRLQMELTADYVFEHVGNDVGSSW